MSEIIKYQPGEVVIKEGDTGKGFYVLGYGVLEVIKGDRHIATLDKPTTFGEMSDILGLPRTCTIVAKTESEVMHMPQGLEDIVEEKPQLAKRLFRDLAARLAETTEKLAQSQANTLWSFENQDTES